MVVIKLGRSESCKSGVPCRVQLIFFPRLKVSWNGEIEEEEGKL